ncbi:alpha/beta hydrolase family protein, partial [Millionella massiliensis]|uniref:alpha/beta hydrolase family protein n=1 Tax=Millionella massiliensis TaxID=1871023 RepID=UPI0023A8576B
MTSATGGIRWGSGLPRMFQYEHGQSRIGGSLWEKPIEYIENSPLFFANKVHTPMLMRHDDADEAVPWYQGIEYFLALRRHGVPVWMLNYNGQPHNLRRYADRLDWDRRMMQFFDHYLKGAPAPRWMREGIPVTDKGIDPKLDY